MMEYFRLEDCPFCGRAVRYGSYEGRGSCIRRIRLVCDKCKYVMDLSLADDNMFPDEDVIDIWNRRPKV